MNFGKAIRRIGTATFFVGMVLAVPARPAYAWSQADRITEIKVVHGNTTLVRFQNISWHGCGGSSPSNPNPFFVISEGDSVSPQRKQMLAIALTALAAGKNVWVVTGGSDGDSPGCSGSGYEWVYQISIYP